MSPSLTSVCSQTVFSGDRFKSLNSVLPQAPQDQSQKKPCATRHRISFFKRFRVATVKHHRCTSHNGREVWPKAGGRCVCAAVSFVAPEGAATAQTMDYHPRQKKLTLLAFPQGELLHLDLWRSTSCKNNSLLFTLCTPGGAGKL